jgi:AcrR family transcriptional regulator
MSREEILAGARRLIERKGLRELSMPGLARYLRSGVTSLYWYFRSKDDLLVALAEEVATELYQRLPPVGDRAWDRELEAWFVAFREEARRTPVYLALFEHHARFLFSRPAVAQLIVRRLEDVTAILVGAGFSAEQAAHIYGVCSVYTRGFVLLEHGLVGENPESGVDEVIDRTVARLDPKAFPTLTQLPSFERAMWLDDTQFRLGLRLMIEGIRRELDAAGPRR